MPISLAGMLEMAVCFINQQLGSWGIGSRHDASGIDGSTMTKAVCLSSLRAHNYLRSSASGTLYQDIVHSLALAICSAIGSIS